MDTESCLAAVMAIITYYNMLLSSSFPSLRINSGLNFQDLMARLGAIDSPPKTPTILGFECAGEVEAVGEGVEDFQVNKYCLNGYNYGCA